MTSERLFERLSTAGREIEPLSEEEQERLDRLVRKVERHGSPSVLTEKELKEYNRLGERSNLTRPKGVLLPDAIEPWVYTNVVRHYAATPTPDDLEATGDCYSSSGSLVLDPFNGEYSSWTLVHGRPTLRVPPYIEYGHAWLESPDGEIIYDPTVEFEGPKMLYYALGNINPEDSFKYSREEARKKILEFGHWGPWEGVDAAPPVDTPDEEDEGDEEDY